MHEVLLQNFCPAFGLLPHLAMLAVHPPLGGAACPPDFHWTLELPLNRPGFRGGLLG